MWKNTDKFNTEKNDRTINALGVGYSMNFKNFDLKTSYARGFGGESTPTSEAEFSTNKSKLLAQLMVRF